MGARRSVWWWVAVGGVAVACLGAIAGAVFVAGVIGSRGRETAAVARADAAYASAIASLSAVGDGFAAAGGVEATSGALAPFVADARGSIASARADLAASRAAIGELPDSEARTTYLTALKEADDGLASIRSMLDMMGGTSTLLAEADAALALYQRGNDALNAAVAALNADRWQEASRAASDASSLLAQAREGFARAGRVDSSAGMDKAVAYVDAQARRAATVTRMAGVGAGGDVAAYNGLVGELNALNRTIAAMPQPEALADEGWATSRLDALRAAATDHIARADELMRQAHSLYAGE